MVKKFIILAMSCFLMSCAAAQIAPDVYRLNQSVERMKVIVETNKDKITQAEYNDLKKSYEDWQTVLDILHDNGCYMQVGEETCSLNLDTIKEMHKLARQAYDRAYPIAVKNMDKLSIHDQSSIKEFNTVMIRLDKEVTKFENSPDVEKTVNIVKIMSTLAVIANKILPIILSNI